MSYASSWPATSVFMPAASTAIVSTVGTVSTVPSWRDQRMKISCTVAHRLLTVLTQMLRFGSAQPIEPP
jgi:hypothetical protein